MDALANSRDAVMETLTHEGIEVVAVGDLAAAMDELLLAEDRGEPYQQILIVLGEPGGDGDQMLELVPRQPWQLTPHVSVLVPQSRRRELAVDDSNPLPIVTLPVHRVALLEAMGLRSPPTAPPESDAPEGDGGRAAILLVEDNPINQKVALAMLGKLGYQVDAVDNGALAVAAVGRRHYQLVLMDIQMPEMDGLEATRRIRLAEAEGRLRVKARLGHLPIVAMTAHALESDRLSCLEAGMDAVITKPVKRQVLGATLARVLGGTPASGLA
jgi:CheY-like chemotaxis protein